MSVLASIHRRSSCGGWGAPKGALAAALAAVSLGCSRGHPPAATTPPDASPTAAEAAPRRDDVTFRSGDLHLRGWVVRVPDDRPRPVLVYNHGSGHDVTWDDYGQVATWIARHGYVAFLPFRRGVQGSEGPHEEETIPPDVDRLLASDDDVLAALAWVRAQPWADPRRVAVLGCSFGGIHALFAAERDPGVFAAVDFAGASSMWNQSTELQARMRAAARAARAPVMFVQAKNDYHTDPSEQLSAEMRDHGKLAELAIYPPYGHSPRTAHGFCLTGMDTWGQDVLAFLQANAPP